MQTFRVVSGCLVLLLCASVAEGQEPRFDPGLQGQTHIGVGYVVNMPRQMMGFDAFVVSPALRNWGFYADYKKTIDSRTDQPTYDADMTVEEAESFDPPDLLMESESEWETLNLAVIRVVSPALALYVGGGTSKESALRRYFDETATRGLLGTYWLDSAAESGTRVNVLGGAIFRITSSFVVQFGLEAAPAGGTVGISYVLPLNQ